MNPECNVAGDNSHSVGQVHGASLRQICLVDFGGQCRVVQGRVGRRVGELHRRRAGNWRPGNRRELYIAGRSWQRIDNFVNV